MYLSYWEIIISMQTCKFLCIFYINPTHNIDKLQEGSKVESGIVMNKMLRLGLTDVGLAWFYRYGPYSLPTFNENSAWKLVFHFAL